MSADRKTLSVYDAKVADYVKMAVGDDDFPNLNGFMNEIPAGGKVLDLGCGPGTKAAIMAKAGFDVDAVDASVEMVEFARNKRNVPARVATFDDISGERIYDGIWANFSLLHARKAELPAYLDAIHKALKSGGVFHIGMKLGEGEKRDRIGRFYAYYSKEELMDLLQIAGFTPVYTELGSGKGMDGTESPWIVVRAHA